MPAPAWGLERWVVGGGTASWAAVDALRDTVDVTSRPGWLRPDSLSATDNLALSSIAREGGVSSPQGVMRLQEVKRYEGRSVANLMNNLIDGDMDTVFEMDDESARGTLTGFVVLDLGTVVPGVRQIRFSPGRDSPARFMRGFALSINDGLPTSLDDNGSLIWGNPILANDENETSVVVVDIPPQPVRFIQLKSRTTQAWEVAELEVYGGGFIREGRFLSQVIDLGEAANTLANLGVVEWSAEVDTKAQLEIRTRSGATPEPDLYFRLQVAEGDTVAIVLPDSTRSGTAAEQYETLSENLRRVQPDLRNWSSWSAPYDSSGQRIRSPSPRRYVQVQLQLTSLNYEHRAQVDSLAFTYTAPVNASNLSARVSPTKVPAGTEVTFDFELVAQVGVSDRGFDAIRVSTPVAATSVSDLSIDGEPVAADSVRLGEDGFVIFFPRFTASHRVLRFRFVSQVLVFGTEFTSEVFERDRLLEIPQRPEIDDSELAVSVVLDDRLLPALKADPRVVTPNGDGINDVTTISYQVLKVLEAVPVRLSIFDLSGRTIWRRTLRQTFGIYSVTWDGHTDAGVVVPPGLYPFQIEVDSQTVTDARVGLIGVAY